MMHKLQQWTAACVSLVLVLAVIPAYSQAARRSPDTAPVTSVLDRMLDALNRQDPAKFAGCFTEDADFVMSRGGHIHGRKAISEMIAKQIKQHRMNNQARRIDVSVKTIKPDVAVA